jgi:hypothetical protein
MGSFQPFSHAVAASIHCIDLYSMLRNVSFITQNATPNTMGKCLLR